MILNQPVEETQLYSGSAEDDDDTATDFHTDTDRNSDRETVDHWKLYYNIISECKF